MRAGYHDEQKQSLAKARCHVEALTRGDQPKQASFLSMSCSGEAMQSPQHRVLYHLSHLLEVGTCKAIQGHVRCRWAKLSPPPPPGGFIRLGQFEVSAPSLWREANHCA